MPEWAATFGTTRAAGRDPPQGQPLPPGVAREAAEGAHDVGDADMGPGDNIAAAVEVGGADGSGSGPGAGDDKSAHWRDEIVRNRKEALFFIEEQSGGTLATLLSLRLQLEPLRSLLHLQIVMSSDRWERVQRQREAKKIADKQCRSATVQSSGLCSWLR